MTMPNLATVADLSTRGISITDEGLVQTLLAAASAVVRGAAQSPILQTTSTVTVWATDPVDRWLHLPGHPVTAVAEVAVDGDVVATNSYRLVDGRLWCVTGPWCEDGTPTPVQVTMTHGLPEVPADICHLVCDLVALGLASASAGAVDPRVVTQAIDDYSVTFAPGAERVATALELPHLTRMALRTRFGGGTHTVASL